MFEFRWQIYFFVMKPFIEFKRKPLLRAVLWILQLRGGGVPHEAQGPTHLRLQVQPEPATLAGVCCERRSRKNLDVVQSGASTGHCRRASIGLRLKCKSLVRNGNQFTEGLRALWSGGSIQFIPTLNSGKFGLGCRGFWSSVRYRSIVRSWCLTGGYAADRGTESAAWDRRRTTQRLFTVAGSKSRLG